MRDAVSRRRDIVTEKRDNSNEQAAVPPGVSSSASGNRLSDTWWRAGAKEKARECFQSCAGIDAS